MKEYTVTLNNFSDKTSFCNEMTASSGSGSVPSRACTCDLMRPQSRNTIFTLSDAEATELLNDSRVLACEENVALNTKELWSSSQQASWDKSPDDASDKNWGIKRLINGQATANWGTNGSSDYTEQVNTTSSGKNVDVIIVDSHINFGHPEFKANPNGTGSNRAVEFNWFQYSAALGYSGNTAATYVYTGGNSSHGTHVAGTVAGNTQGWARDANIYNMSFASDAGGGNGISGLFWYNIMFEYIRHFHNNKPINAATGRRNPTIVNNSWSFAEFSDEPNLSAVDSVKYRAESSISLSGQTDAQKKTTLQSKRISVPGSSTIPNFNKIVASVDADIIDCMNDGVVFCSAAGNDYMPTDVSGGEDYNNAVVVSGVTYYPIRGGTPGTTTNMINVGATAATVSETKAVFTNFEERVDVYAPGRNIMSSVKNTSSGYSNQVADSRDSNYYNASANGTSMATPQVCGLLACAAEQYPNMRQANALQYLIEGAKAQIATTSEDPPTQSPYTSFGDGNNRYVSYVFKRPQSGTAFPHDNHGNRVSSSNGVKYPRVNSLVTKRS